MTTATPIRHPARTMLYKACPRCHGDLIVDPENEIEGSESLDFVCLQCGRSVTMKLVDIAAAQRRRAAAA